MAVHGEPKPTEKTIGDLEQQLLGIWNATHTDWDTKLSYYNGTFQVWSEEALRANRPNLRPSKAAAKVDGAVNSLLASEPIVHRTPLRGGKRAEPKGDKLETWMSGLLADAFRREPVSPERQVKHSLMLLGYAVVEGPLLQETAPPEEPGRGESAEYEAAMQRFLNQRRLWQPIRIRVPVPKSVLLDPLEKRPTCAIKRAMWYAKDIQAMLEMRKGKKYGKAEQVWDYDAVKPYEQVLCLECWSEAWHSMAIAGLPGRGGRMLFVEENEWGYVPFGHCFSGWGSSSASGGTSGTPQASDLGLSVSFMSKGILDSLIASGALVSHAQAVSGRHMALMKLAAMKMGTKLEGSEAAQKLQGDIVDQLASKEDMWWMETPNMPQWAFQAEAGFEREIEEATFSDVLVGIRPEGVSTVGAHAMLREDAGTRFVPPMKQMSDMFTIVGQNILRLVEVVDEPITAGGEKIDASDIQGNYDITISFESADPIVKMQEKAQAREDLDKGHISLRDYLAIIGTEDATGVYRRILEDKVLTSPEVIAEIMKIVRAGLGLPEPVLTAPGGLVGPTGQPMGASSPMPTNIMPGMPPSTEVVPPGSPQEAAAVSEGMRRLLQGG